jgi:hypothetical protein
VPVEHVRKEGVITVKEGKAIDDEIEIMDGVRCVSLFFLTVVITSDSSRDIS